MKLDLQENSHANITFNNIVKVAVRGEHAYTVKYYCNDELAGEMNLGGGNWGGYEIVIGEWRIEFWQGDNLVKTYLHSIKETNILILTSFELTHRGKLPDFSPISEQIRDIEQRYNCTCYLYFPGSEKFELSFKTLKMNDDVDFSMMLEKQF